MLNGSSINAISINRSRDEWFKEFIITVNAGSSAGVDAARGIVDGATNRDSYVNKIKQYSKEQKILNMLNMFRRDNNDTENDEILEPVKFNGELKFSLNGKSYSLELENFNDIRKVNVLISNVETINTSDTINVTIDNIYVRKHADIKL